MSLVIRAIDVGYSWTKYVVEGDRVDGIRCRAFPSVAPRASGRDLALDGLTLRRTVQIAIEGVVFEVGAEAPLVQDVVQAFPHDDSIHPHARVPGARPRPGLSMPDHADSGAMSRADYELAPEADALSFQRSRGSGSSEAEYGQDGGATADRSSTAEAGFSKESRQAEYSQSSRSPTKRSRPVHGRPSLPHRPRCVPARGGKALVTSRSLAGSSPSPTASTRCGSAPGCERDRGIEGSNGRAVLAPRVDPTLVYMIVPAALGGEPYGRPLPRRPSRSTIGSRLAWRLRSTHRRRALQDDGLYGCCWGFWMR
jgi:hypothetical protein